MRYIVFGFHGYYPSGGLNDVVGVYNDKKEALSVGNQVKEDFDYVEIFDSKEWKTIESYYLGKQDIPVDENYYEGLKNKKF